MQNEAQLARAEIGHKLGQAKQRLAESLERQPLLLGALGIAIGAGIASAFPSTTLETELMGKQGTAAREKLENASSSGTHHYCDQSKPTEAKGALPPLMS